jgi:hypothetical protein
MKWKFVVKWNSVVNFGTEDKNYSKNELRISQMKQKFVLNFGTEDENSS